MKSLVTVFCIVVVGTDLFSSLRASDLVLVESSAPASTVCRKSLSTASSGPLSSLVTMNQTRKPEEILVAGVQIQTAEQLKQLLREKNGVWIFLIDEAGQLFIEHRFGRKLPNQDAAYLVTHRSLRELAFMSTPLEDQIEFLAAGELMVQNGFANVISNKTGTFKESCTEEHLKFARLIFAEFGVEVSESIAYCFENETTSMKNGLDSDHLAETDQARLYFRHMRDPQLRELRDLIERKVAQYSQRLPHPSLKGLPDYDRLRELVSWGESRCIDDQVLFGFFGEVDEDGEIEFDAIKAETVFEFIQLNWIPYLEAESVDFVIDRVLGNSRLVSSYYGGNPLRAAQELFQILDHLLVVQTNVSQENVVSREVLQ